MPLAVGDKLGPYEILARLGAGGMGEVWKARDMRLDRIVAIKISRGNFDERFEREARSIAALNHPNICQLYDVDPNYLVMEFVEGSPIAMADGVRKLLDLAVQIADGLAAAHGGGILHRDLKPDNILVTRDGRVKVLDFGLAKSLTARPADDATLTIGITDPGTVVGTVNYMSPEQARGEANLTPQSDQFSFGVVLYELATGKRAFQRGSAPETMTAIIREDADPLPGSVPAPLRWVIERLLAKEPAERYDSTRDLYRELKQIRDRLSQATSAQSPAAAVSTPKRKRGLILGAGAVACLAAGSALTLFLSPSPVAAPDLSAYKFTPLSRAEAEEDSPQWAPDGKSIAYTRRIHGVMQVFTQPAGTLDAVQLTKADQNCSSPFWSPDGASVYYISEGSLWSVSAAGGASQKAYEGVTAATLHPDGKTLAFDRGRKLWIGSLKGGEAKELWQGPTNGGLSFSPDGSKLAVDSIGPIMIVPYPSGSPRPLEAGGPVLTAPSWFPDNRHLAVAVRNQAGDRATLSIVDITDGTRRTIGVGATGFVSPSVSVDGKRIAYQTGQWGWDVLEISIPNGELRTLVAGGISVTPDWAPSGTHFIFSIPTGEGAGIVDQQAGGEGFSRRLGDAKGRDPQWSPDGGRFVFYREVDRIGRLMLANAAGGGAVLLDSIQSGTLGGMAWSPDGQWISYLREISGKQDLVKVRATPGSAPEIVANAKPQSWVDSMPRWSPAGDWIAYPAADGIDLISPDGKSTRKLTSRKFLAYGFSKDGSQFYGVFQNTTGNGAQWQLYSVNVKSGAEKFLAPIDLPASVDRIAGFSIHPDGKRFLTSVAKFPFDIWMLEGFEQPEPKSFLDRLLRR
ncbi:MAG TPA: protein kinase [Candidatus Acidoferrales bacterium]|jgi:serine/threonine protein kinase|nr:protein kinase [Candidatus Acidoferrales bacterium]